MQPCGQGVFQVSSSHQLGVEYRQPQRDLLIKFRRYSAAIHLVFHVLVVEELTVRRSPRFTDHKIRPVYHNPILCVEFSTGAAIAIRIKEIVVPTPQPNLAT